MKDSRIEAFRIALERLTESLDATLRLKRWDPTDAVPEPLSKVAAQLTPTLELIERLSAPAFVGSSTDTAKMSAMRAAALRLTTAYGSYRNDPAETGGISATMALEDEVGSVRQDASAWTS